MKHLENIYSELCQQVITWLNLNKDLGYVVLDMNTYNRFCNERYNKPVSYMTVNGIEMPIVVLPIEQELYCISIIHASSMILNHNL